MKNLSIVFLLGLILNTASAGYYGGLAIRVFDTDGEEVTSLLLHKNKHQETIVDYLVLNPLEEGEGAQDGLYTMNMSNGNHFYILQCVKIDTESNIRSYTEENLVEAEISGGNDIAKGILPINDIELQPLRNCINSGLTFTNDLLTEVLESL